jgi:S-adenosylmethionine:tRNA ribosyltransferase-isomerase
MKTSDFDYHLPPELIAQTPIEPRDASRLLVLRRQSDQLEHRCFPDITELLRPDDVLVFNNSRVIPARLHGRKADTGAKVEILLLRRLEPKLWEALVKPGKKLAEGAVVEISRPGCEPVSAEIRCVLAEGMRQVWFADEALLPQLGEMPLPPYIHTPLDRPERYQTVYAREQGSAAAPTAGLHFTPELLQRLNDKGIETLYTTLHIGLDTFRPVQVEDPSQHPIHHEYGVVGPEVAARLSLAKSQGRRIICVGTTSVRLLEYAALQSKSEALEPFAGWVDLFILPGFKFRLTDAMITNFHLPRSSLIMLVSAFAGLERIKMAYAEAVKERYRFYSFGDAMLIE